MQQTSARLIQELSIRLSPIDTPFNFGGTSIIRWLRIVRYLFVTVYIPIAPPLMLKEGVKKRLTDRLVPIIIYMMIYKSSYSLSSAKPI
jgi:hypothetical protein